MNREDLIRMAREAFIKRGFWPNEIMWECWKDAWIAAAAAEREACAIAGFNACVDPNESVRVRDAIRARGQA